MYILCWVLDEVDCGHSDYEFKYIVYGLTVTWCKYPPPPGARGSFNVGLASQKKKQIMYIWELMFRRKQIVPDRMNGESD